MIFAAGLTPPDDGMTAYLPMLVQHESDQRAILRAWERKPPEVIIYWGEDQSPVFGYAGFGQDYALEIARWITERYELASLRSGSTLLLVPRRSSSPPPPREAGAAIFGTVPTGHR